MRIAAHDVGRLSRLAAGCAGVAVAAVGSLSATPRVPPGLSPAAALVPAGVALLLQALPAGRISRALAVVLALVAAGVGALTLDTRPAAAIATVLAGLGPGGTRGVAEREPTAATATPAHPAVSRESLPTSCAAICT